MIDINCDMGEVNELLKDKTYSKLMDHVTSINIACGGHAGDENMMRKIKAFINHIKTNNMISPKSKKQLENYQCLYN